MIYDIPDNWILDSAMEIDDVLQEIAKREHKCKHWEEVKKHRAQILDKKIVDTTDEINQLRKVILETMKKHAPDDKTLDFSPVGKVTRKNVRQKWIIENEKELMEYLEQKGIKERVTTTVEKINKKELDKVLSRSKDGEVPGVTLDAGQETISISFEKSYKPGQKSTETQQNAVEENEVDVGEVII